MVVSIRSLGLSGIAGYGVVVECALSGGLPAFDVVGLPDAAVRESRERVAAIEQDIQAEEYRLKQAQESTAAYVKKLAQFHEQEMAFLAGLGELVPPESAQEPRDDPSAQIEAAVAAQVLAEAEPPKAEEKPAPRLVAVGPDDDVPPMPDDLLLPGMDDGELDADATRRFSDMQFGRDYKIE